MKKLKENLLENICFYDGVLMTISLVFLIRNISVIIGSYIPFSGNIEMRFTDIEIWRYIFFALYMVTTIILFILIHKKEMSLKEKFTKYYSSFLTGLGIMFGFEIFFHYIGYKLGTTGILF